MSYPQMKATIDLGVVSETIEKYWPRRTILFLIKFLPFVKYLISMEFRAVSSLNGMYGVSIPFSTVQGLTFMVVSSCALQSIY